MTEPGFTDAMGEPDLDAREADEVIDNDVLFGDDDPDQGMDTSYSPPERPRGLDAFGTTLAEERRGETLDQRLAEEEPDPALAVEPIEDLDLTPQGGGHGADEPVPADRDRIPGDDPALGDRPFDEESGETAQPRSGRLVAPDEGLSADEEKDLVASDVGIDAGAASAEEAAMHVVDEDHLQEEGIVTDEGSTR